MKAIYKGKLRSGANASSYILSWQLCLILIISCKSSYEDVVSQELASGVRNDTVWYDIHFNMSRKTFEEHAFNMNLAGVFKEADRPGNITIIFETEFSYPVECVFFPEFNDEQVEAISGTFHFSYWNGFNRAYDNNVLQRELIKKFEHWYGGKSFFELNSKEMVDATGPIYVKIDGNRQIKLWNSIDYMHVNFKISDIS